MAKSYDKPAGGRLKRMAKLAGLGARLSTEVATRGMKRLSGNATGLLSSAGAEKLVSTLGELKGLAMKIGQSLAMDPDLLTPEVQAIVARLQNQAPPMPFAAVSQVILDELGAPVEKLFKTFEATPLASASLGQVHGAVTWEDSSVVVKVQYPGVDVALQSDLANIGSTAVLLGRALGVPAQEYFSEIRGALLEELDYRREAVNAEAFARACDHIVDLRVPKIFPALSAGKVLTLERLDGETLKDLLARRAEIPNARRFEISRLLIHSTFGPFLKSGLIHADPHPGNFLLLPDGRLGVLDFGNVRQTSKAWLEVNQTLMDHALGHLTEPLDLIALSKRAGFTFKTDAEKLRPFVEGVVALVLEPVQSESYDYGSAKVLQRMRSLFVAHALVVKTKMLPPPEGLLFFRAVGGLVQNLQSLGAQGPFRSVYAEMMEPGWAEAKPSLR